jgi:glucosamine--fructose-6-phosphate aminotransferase (isomerizing)
MTEPGPTTLMHREAAQAADVVAQQFARNQAVAEALGERLRRRPPPFVATCARGSSDHAATYAKYLFETQLGLVTASISPSVGSIYAARQRLRDALYIVISQSGKSPDLLHNAEAARESGACVVALVNHEDSPLAQLAEVVLPLHAGAERSVAATKSFIASLSAVLQLVACWTEDPALAAAQDALPDALRAAWALDWSPLVDGLGDARNPVNNMFVLGRGLGLATAQEAALKFKETCALHAEAYSAAEVKHGPMALVGPGFPVLAFVQPDETAAGTQALAREFRARGAQVWLADERGLSRTRSGDDGEPGHLPLAPAPHPACAPLLAIQSFYRAAEALSRRRGFDPDAPAYLNKVTETV